VLGAAGAPKAPEGDAGAPNAAPKAGCDAAGVAAAPKLVCVPKLLGVPKLVDIPNGDAAAGVLAAAPKALGCPNPEDDAPPKGEDTAAEVDAVPNKDGVEEAGDVDRAPNGLELVVAALLDTAPNGLEVAAPLAGPPNDTLPKGELDAVAAVVVGAAAVAVPKPNDPKLSPSVFSSSAALVSTFFSGTSSFFFSTAAGAVAGAVNAANRACAA
jgi:hypothetical protein